MPISDPPVRPRVPERRSRRDAPPGRFALGRQGAEGPMAREQAMMLAHSGRLQLANTMWLHAIELARQKSDREGSAMVQTGAALSEAHAGNGEAACKPAKAAQ